MSEWLNEQVSNPPQSGGLAEWLNARVSKTRIPQGMHRFKSCTLRFWADESLPLRTMRNTKIIIFTTIAILSLLFFLFKNKLTNESKTYLGHEYSKDINTVYFDGLKIVNADIKSFQVLTSYPCCYAKDWKNVYKNNKRIDGVDVDSFEVVSVDSIFSYAKDKNYAYYLGERILGSDGSSFQYINYAWVKDKNFVYLLNRKVPEIDTQSFHILEGKYAKDKNNIYYYAFKNFETSMDMFYQTMKNTDLNSFKYLGCDYAQDNKSVYFRNVEIKEGDTVTFQIYNEDCEHLFFAKDKNHVYKDGQILKGTSPHNFDPKNSIINRI